MEALAAHSSGQKFPYALAQPVCPDPKLTRDGDPGQDVGHIVPSGQRALEG